MAKTYSFDEVLSAIAVEGADGTEGCCGVIEEGGECCMRPGMRGKLRLAEEMGWVLVPLEATDEMAAAATQRPPDPRSGRAIDAWRNVWSAMISARPKAQE